MVKNILTSGRFVSLAIVIFGFVFQVVLWFFSFALVTSEMRGDSLITTITNGASIILFCFPLISIVGIYSGVAYQRKHGRSIFAILGILLNLIWLLLFLFIFFMVFVMGVTA